MATFTSSLPDDLLKRLSIAAKDLKLPKNRLIEKALEIYLEQLERSSYAKSYKQAGDDHDIMIVAEEGFKDYMQSLDNTDS